ncbi:PREDICTED: endocuticle structural glycoprotein SgAbd-8-like [Habropoda laboriosa]|nr:PREDICTED: endocuticle structural glycoprotein SgAbd-8-like [Habropoda laboriosa]
MFIRLLCFLSLMVMALAADTPIAIVRQSQDISPDGSFSTKWESANGITFEEEGVLKNRGQKDTEAEEVRGSASWTAPDGTKVNLGWLANENGATFQGAHLPTPPPTQPIPVLIQRALDWIAANPSRDEKNRL